MIINETLEEMQKRLVKEPNVFFCMELLQIYHATKDEKIKVEVIRQLREVERN